MRLAPAVREPELTHGFLILAGEAADDVTGQVEERRRRVRESKELLRVLVDAPPAAFERDVVEVGGELVERELAGPEVIAQADNLVPRGPRRLTHRLLLF